ncbi:unnamed protein product [Kuraishia capsulata CBS 1993]|uniref:Uncharacterized protein n=1 Tax=Kuraishia capsulata CBS 1993 TaxID=1382522 RepID=W6MLN8_9ASCO|nr:uncharacterized protein KUCA_T00001742001 [Kuraishia capsulata CBS 1993]CDK25772.1 unnamed protein product [Kuraishia capsulata CBS 1993]
MAVSRILTHLLTIFLLAGTTLLLVFVVLSGASDHFPFNKFYWLEADTTKITGDVSRWTFWGICNPSGNTNGNCTSSGPDFPLSPVDNFGTTKGLPTDFVDNRDVYYYLTRFSFPFILISLCFTGVALICSLFSFCWNAMRTVLVFFVCAALLFAAAGVSLETAAVVLARNAFKDDGISQSLGASMLGISWGAVAALIVIYFLVCCSTLTRAYKTHKQHQQAISATQETQELQQPYLGTSTTGQNQGTLPPPASDGGIRFFKIRKDKATDEESI